MMSAPQTQLKLKALECHFTWDLDSKRSKLLRLQDKLEDIGTEETKSWLGPIYNLQGFIQYKLGSTEEAQRLLSSATEVLRQQRKADQGPWLVVNYGNLAWLHHHLGEEDQSQAYLSKVDALIEEHPSPLQEELHPEVLAEKAWYLMKFDKEKRLQAADYFQRAVRMQPDMLQWQTSRVVALVTAHKHSETELDDGIMEEMRMATQEDPDNLYLAALDLQQRAKSGEGVTDEAEELTGKILLNPVSSYSGIKPLLRLFRQLDLYDKAIEVAEEALRNHPDERYLKRCAALTYKWKVIFSRDSRPNQRMIDRAITLHEELISLYPHSSFPKKIDLANIHAKSIQGLMRADQMYQELLERDLEPSDQQLLYNGYAKYLHFERRDGNNSIRYHMRAAEIPHESFFRQNSIKSLKKIADRGRHRMCREIQEFLENLQDYESE
ncbi:interferon-induced protein with tetratricopeptide repeats 1-like isoform 2-T2 [Menidia menidia]